MIVPLYLNDEDISLLGVNWNDAIKIIRSAIQCLNQQDYSQPIKQYLRYNSAVNRIIAMPAYLGGKFQNAGIKWISSFPDNVNHNMQRAHSVTILNQAGTGIPECIINSGKISGIRTAAVSGLVLSEVDKIRSYQDATLGIIGFGPIGRLHLDMAASLLGNRLSHIFIYDLKGIRKEEIPAILRSRVQVCDSWQEVYEQSQIFITATVSSSGYIDSIPLPGSLILNVSLRDFKPQILHHINYMVVDDWDEVCRENTDIHRMHQELGLQKPDISTAADMVCRQLFDRLDPNDTIMFNPMGMGVFDIAMAAHYFSEAGRRNIGTSL